MVLLVNLKEELVQLLFLL